MSPTTSTASTTTLSPTVATCYLVDRSGNKAIAAALHDFADALNEQDSQISADYAIDGRHVVVASAAPTSESLTEFDLVMFFDPTLKNAPGALAFHDEESGAKFAYVGVNDCLSNGGTISTGAGSVSQAASHEYCEDKIDPNCNDWIDTTAQGNADMAKETCDPVEGEFYNASNGVALSNYVLPSYWDFQSKKKPWDKLGKLKGPMSIAPDGYAIIRIEKGQVQQVNGAFRNPNIVAQKQGAKTRAVRRASGRAATSKKGTLASVHAYNRRHKKSG